jgi:hypothetical protein
VVVVRRTGLGLGLVGLGRLQLDGSDALGGRRGGWSAD